MSAADVAMAKRASTASCRGVALAAGMACSPREVLLE